MAPRGDCALVSMRPLAANAMPLEIRDGQLIDVEPVVVDLHPHVGLLHLDSADRSPADLQRQGASLRPIESDVARDRLGDRMNTVEINLGAVNVASSRAGRSLRVQE